jgi:hypothetical protein
MTTNHENNHINTQIFADVLKANCYHMNEAALREIAYIGYIASEQGEHQQAAGRGIYQQLMKARFKATAENCDLLANLVEITIENLRLINYGTLDNPSYYKDFFSAIEAILPTTKQAARLLDDLHAQFGKGWKVLPNIQQTA